MTLFLHYVNFRLVRPEAKASMRILSCPQLLRFGVRFHLTISFHWPAASYVNLPNMIGVISCSIYVGVFPYSPPSGHTRKSSALRELHRLLARLGVEELGQVLAEEELYHAGGAVAMLAHQDVGNVLLLGFRVI